VSSSVIHIFLGKKDYWCQLTISMLKHDCDVNAFPTTDAATTSALTELSVGFFAADPALRFRSFTYSINARTEVSTAA